LFCFRKLGYAGHDKGSTTPLTQLKLECPVGVNLHWGVCTGQGVRQYIRPVDFSNLFVTANILKWVCKFNNENEEIFGLAIRSL